VGALAGGGTEAEEPDAVPEYMNEADETSQSPPRGGDRREEGDADRRPSLRGEPGGDLSRKGTSDYYEVENQRRKAFKGNIYKAKVVNIATPSRRRSSSSGAAATASCR